METQGLPSLESAIENLDSLLEEMAKSLYTAPDGSARRVFWLKAPGHLWAQRVLGSNVPKGDANPSGN